MTFKESTSKKPYNVGKYYDFTELDHDASLVIEKGNYTGIVDKAQSVFDLELAISNAAEIDGLDLVFDVDNDLGNTLSVRVKDYFAKGGKINLGIAGGESFELNFDGLGNDEYYTYTITPDLIENKNLFNSYTLKSDYEKAPKVITGTNFADTFDFQKAAAGVTINAGAGDDVITGSAQADKITGGAGINTLLIDPTKALGADEITLTKDENLIIRETISRTGAAWTGLNPTKSVDYSFAIDGKDVVLTVQYTDTETPANSKTNTIRLLGAASKDILGEFNDVKVYDKNGDLFMDDPLASLKTSEVIGLEAKKDTYTGGYLGEKVVNGAKDETFKLGLGGNVVTTDLTDPTKTFGEDKITLTKDEALKLKFTGDIANQVVSRVAENKKDVEVVAYKTGAVTYTAVGVRNTETTANADSMTRTVVTVNNETNKTTTQVYNWDNTQEAGHKWVAAGEATVADKKEGDVASEKFVATFGTGATAKTLEFVATGGNKETIPEFYKQVGLTGTRTSKDDATALTAGTDTVGYSLLNTGDVVQYYKHVAGDADDKKTEVDAAAYNSNQLADFTGVSGVAQATFTIVGAATKDLGGLVTIAGENNIDMDVIGGVTYDVPIPEKGNKLTGTAVNDVVDLSDATVDTKIKGYNVNTGLGDDIITGSAGNDTISAGLSSSGLLAAGNTINIDLANGKFGDDVINVTKGEITNIAFDNDTLAGQVTLTHNGKDAILTAYGKTVYACDVKFNSAANGVYNAETNKTTFAKEDLQVASINAEGTAYGELADATVDLVLDGDFSANAYKGTTLYVVFQKDSKGNVVATDAVAAADLTKVGQEYGATLVDTTAILGTVTVKGIAAKDNVRDPKTFAGVISVSCDNPNNVNGNLNSDGLLGEPTYDIDLAATTKDAKGNDKNVYITGKEEKAKANFKGTYTTETVTLADEDLAKSTTLSLGGGGVDTVLYNLNKKYGEVTVNAVKGDNVTLRDDNSVALLDTVNSEYKIDGKDVVVSVTRDNQTPADTTDDVSIVDFRIKNYAAKDPGATILNGVADLKNQTYDAVEDKKGNYTTGTWLNETAVAKDGVTYKLGLGENSVTYNAAAAGADKFKTNGAIVNLTKDEDFAIRQSNADLPVASKVTYKYDSDGKDATVTAVYDVDGAGETPAVEVGKYVFKGLAAKDLGATVTIDQVEDIDVLTQDFTLAGKETKGQLTYTGTWLNDVAAAKDGDTYKLGLGVNKITYDATNAAFNEDGATVNLTKDETLKLVQTNALGGDKEVTYTYESDGKDATVTAWYDTDKNDDTAPSPVGKFVFKGAAAKDLGAEVLVDSDSNGVYESLFDKEFTLVGTETNKGGLSYKGTWLNDFATGLAAKDDTFNLGAGNNRIEMLATGAIGKDTVTLTANEDLTVNLNEAIAGQVSYEKVGNDIVANLAATSAVASYTKVATVSTDVTANITANSLTETNIHDVAGTLKQRTRTFTTATGKWSAWSDDAATEATAEGSTFKATISEVETALDADVVAAYLGEGVGEPGEEVYTPGHLYKNDKTTTVYAWDATNEDHKQYKNDGGTPADATYSVADATETLWYYKFVGSTDNIYTPTEVPAACLDHDLTTQNMLTDNSKEAYGTVTFKNYALDMAFADVTVNGAALDDAKITIKTTGGTAKGTIAKDDFVVTAKAKKAGEEAVFNVVKDGEAVVGVKGVKNTFVETYTRFDGIDQNTINSVQGAQDVIQIAAGKNAVKLDAFDYDYSFTHGNNELLIYDGAGNHVSYQAEAVDANGKRVHREFVDNTANVQFKDATNTVYQFTTKATNEAGTELDLSKTKTNNIAVGLADTVLTLKDSAKNDIIYSVATTTTVGEGAVNWTYTGGEDKYISGNANADTKVKDNYTVTLGKKTNLEIVDNGGLDTLTLNGEKGKTLTANDLMLLFNVEKTEDAGIYSVGGDGKELIIMQKDAFEKAGSVINAFSSDKWAGGVVSIDKYFGAAAKVTGVSVDNDLTAVTGYQAGVAGTGCIETINVGTTAVDVASKIDAVAEEVAAWLANHGNYDSAYDVFAAGNKNDVQSLLNVYQGASYIPAP